MLIINLFYLCEYTNTRIYIHTGGAKSRKHNNRYLVKSVCVCSMVLAMFASLLYLSVGSFTMLTCFRCHLNLIYIFIFVCLWNTYININTFIYIYTCVLYYCWNKVKKKKNSFETSAACVSTYTFICMTSHVCMLPLAWTVDCAVLISCQSRQSLVCAIFCFSHTFKHHHIWYVAGVHGEPPDTVLQYSGLCLSAVLTARPSSRECSYFNSPCFVVSC